MDRLLPPSRPRAGGETADPGTLPRQLQRSRRPRHRLSDYQPAKGFPFEVAVPEGFSVTGVILSDHARSVDWRGRNAEYLETLPEEVVVAVVDRFSSLLQP